MTINTPPQQVNVSLTHKICEFYKKIYILSSRLSKKDKLGIYLRIENVCLDILQNITVATFNPKNSKLESLISARTEVEILKRLLRITNELGIVQKSKYLELELDLQEISKMTNGWIKYLTAPI
ncbi:MAG: four helix bundle protein [Candidatus Yanofskybacteria bacterium]|nr:four helix bundle protein [Candidatus Yanofskybacteria bacterium]